MIHLPSLNFELGETADMLRDAVQDFAQAEIAPIAAEIDRSNEFPNQLWPKLGEMGLLGITVPETYGGADMGFLTAGVVFGFMFIGLDQLTDDSAVLSVLPLRFGGVLAILLISALRRVVMRPERAIVPQIIASGFIGSMGNLAFILSTASGALAIVAVVASLFPAATVGLAYLFLGERLSRSQLTGVVAALIAVALVSSA